MTFRDVFLIMQRRWAETHPRWFTHLEGMRALDERVDGDSAVVRVRYGEPKEDEEHDVSLVFREGRWLVREWN